MSFVKGVLCVVCIVHLVPTGNCDQRETVTQTSLDSSDPNLIVALKIFLGSTAQIPCGPRHDHWDKLSLSWTFNGKPVKSSSRISTAPDSTLVIREARNTDVGLYACKFVSESGAVDTRTIRLDLIEIPHAPTNVKAELNVAGGLVNVSWSPPFDGNSAIVKYLVERREVNSLDELSYNDANHGWLLFAANISAKQHYALLTDLRPARSYQFRVLAVNSVGKGQPSAPSSPPITLPAQPPSSPPQGVVGAAPSSTSIIVQWTAPPTEGHNGLLLGYIIRYKLAGYTETPWNYRNVTNAGQLSYLLDDLIVWRNYEIQLAAYNVIGVGAYSPSIQVRTKEGSPDAPPSEVAAEALNSTALKVSWSAPDPQLVNGINQGYKLKATAQQVKERAQPFDREIRVSPNPLGSSRKQEAILGDLQPYTRYMITVLAFTSGGDGPSNDPPINVTTAEDLPEAVSSLEFSEVHDTSVQVSWSPPNRVNGHLLAYTVKYAATGARDWKVVNYSAESNETVVSGLLPNATYTFEIHASTKVGPGPATSSTIKTTPSPVVVGELHFSEITMTGLRVSWSPPEAPNRNITGYFVLYEALLGDFSKQVKQKISDTSLLVSGLEENVRYTFRVRAETATGVGPERLGAVTTGPQPGSPAPPKDVTVVQTLTSVKLKWFNPRQREPLLGYLVEGKQVYAIDSGHGLDTAGAPEAHEAKWLPIVSLRNGAQTTYELSFTHLSPSSKYTLRIMAVNSKGISEPAFPVTVGHNARRLEANSTVAHSPSIIVTPSFLELRVRPPFHREAWFVILCACMTVVVTIMVIAVLCVQNKAYKYKKEALKNAAHGSRSGSAGALSEAGFGLENTYASGFELRQNSVAGIRRSSVALNGQAAQPRPPPRPAPGSLSYSDEDVEYGDTIAKQSDLYGSSGDSLTEKPSEMSSSCPETESDQEDGASAAGSRHHFMNHYANVNDTLRKGHGSWKRSAQKYMVKPPHVQPRTSASQGHSSRDVRGDRDTMRASHSRDSLPGRPAPPVPGRSHHNLAGPVASSSASSAAPPSYMSAVAVTASEDSELDSPAVNLNGGRIVVNNMAGSRAPLPGFSSFV
ncbi:Protein sidekick [Halotydeus destructor]|nr:Protein sidekick [Halotydeus destructor]